MSATEPQEAPLGEPDAPDAPMDASEEEGALDGATFEENFLQEPTAAALLVRVERANLAWWWASSAVVWGVAPASDALGWFVGAGVGWVNFAGVRRLLRWALGSNLGRGAVSIALVAKMSLLMGAVWALLQRLPASPIGFVAGFSALLAGLVTASVVWAWRLSPPKPREAGGDP